MPVFLLRALDGVGPISFGVVTRRAHELPGHIAHLHRTVVVRHLVTVASAGPDRCRTPPNAGTGSFGYRVTRCADYRRSVPCRSGSRRERNPQYYCRAWGFEGGDGIVPAIGCLGRSREPFRGHFARWPSWSRLSAGMRPNTEYRPKCRREDLRLPSRRHRLSPGGG